MGNLKERIDQLVQKRPAYQEMLAFYQRIREAQEEVKPSLEVPSIPLKKEWKELLAKEGFPLLERKDFPFDLSVTLSLFQTLCRIAKEATPLMAEQVQKLEALLAQGKLDLHRLVAEAHEEGKIKESADTLGLDRKVLAFLLRESLRPSIEASVQNLLQELDTENWTKNICPVCGSSPSLSLFKGPERKRYLVCSFCSFQWRTDRIACPFCGNKDQSLIHYFYAEGEEAFRVDACDRCHQYLKTIDAHRTEVIEPPLEDLATLHLDLLASKKGYRRPIPTPWMPEEIQS